MKKSQLAGKGETMTMKGWSRLWLAALVFGLGGVSTTTCADDGRALSSGQSLYLPIYSHMLYGNLGKRGQASSVLLSALVSIRNTDPRRPLRVLSARYYDTHGKLLGERVPVPVLIPVLGTHELFVELNDAAGGSGANFIIRWDAEVPINPPLVESLHANMDGGKAVVFLTQSIPIQYPAASPGQQ
jgi:hypothetical protein